MPIHKSNISSINSPYIKRQRLSEWIIKRINYMLSKLQICKDTDSQKVKRWEKIYHETLSQRKLQHLHKYPTKPSSKHGL